MRRDDSFWVAVLPFKFRGADSGLSDLAEAFTEEIVRAELGKWVQPDLVEKFIDGLRTAGLACA